MKSLSILIITRTFYPALNPRSHRATELAKELSRQGHDVTVYALLGNYSYDKFIEETNIKVKNLGNSILGNPNSDNSQISSFYIRIINKIFGKILDFPSIELFPFVRAAIKKENKIDYLITIASPFSIHWAAASIRKKNIKFWVSDCGDPFMGNPIDWHPFYFKYIEKYWCKKTDNIIVPINGAKDAYYSEYKNKIIVIPQGFSFRNIILSKYEINKIPTFAFSGSVYHKFRDPSKFMDYLLTLNFDFKFIVFTKTKSIFQKYIKNLGNKIEIHDYTTRDILINTFSKVDFLINIKNNTSIQEPSKLIDYYISKRPILEISSDFQEIDKFNNFIKGNYSYKKTNFELEMYNIENVAKKFLNIYFDHDKNINNR